MTTRVRHDAGFTLVELMIVIAIVGLIAPAIAAAFFVGFRTTDAVGAEVAAAHNRELFAAFFTEDAQSATAVDAATSPDTTTCLAAGDTLVGRLRWSDRDAANGVTAHAVSYARVTVGTDQQVVRRSCTGGVETDVVLVHNSTAASLSCLSTTYAVVTCTNFVVLRLSATDSSGAFTVDGRRRS